MKIPLTQKSVPFLGTLLSIIGGAFLVLIGDSLGVPVIIIGLVIIVIMFFFLANGSTW